MAGHQQAGVDHVEPVAVKAAVGFGVGAHLHPVHRHAGLRPIGLLAFGKVVFVDKVVARVVGRVYIDALHLPPVGVEQQFQHFEVFALNDQVAVGLLRVHAAGRVVTQGGVSWAKGLAFGRGFAPPLEVEAFRALFSSQARQFGFAEFALVGKQVRKIRLQPRQPLLQQIGALYVLQGRQQVRVGHGF